MMFVPDKKYEHFLADSLQEMSKEEYGGIRNLMILALTEDGHPMTCIMDTSDSLAIGAMLFHANCMSTMKVCLNSDDLVADMAYRIADVEEQLEEGEFSEED